MNLTLGRLSIFNPETFERGDDQIAFSGDYIGSTLAETLAARDDLAAMQDRLIAVTWDDEPTIDGFYRVSQARASVPTLNDTGFIMWSMGLVRVGSGHDVDLQSRITGTVLGNDFSVTEAGSEPFHAPPIGHIAYDTGATVPANITRTGADGGMTVYRDVDFAVDPKWVCDPTDYYKGAAEVELNSLVRTGKFVPDDITNTLWRVNNALVRVSANGTSGRLDIAHHDGTQWETAKVWQVKVGGSEVGEWDRVGVIRNDPEEAIIRLVRTISAGGRYTLDLTLRRGSRFVQGYLTVPSSDTLRVERNTTEAGTNVGNQSIRATSNDVDGNRYVIGSARTVTRNLTIGYIEKSSVTNLDFYIGSEIAGSGAQAGDQAAQLELQYYGNIVEQTEAIKR